MAAMAAACSFQGLSVFGSHGDRSESYWLDTLWALSYPPSGKVDMPLYILETVRKPQTDRGIWEEETLSAVRESL